MRLLSATLIAFSVFLAAGLATAAETATPVAWEDLVPAAKPLGNPLAHLPWEQQAEIEFLASVRRQHAQGLISDVDYRYEEGLEIAYKLKKAGVDVETLVTEFDTVMQEVRRRETMVVDGLDGKLIRMPGYALPLEFTETAISEFLLVPYVGACIHVPPPPLNQTVYVQLNQSYKADRLYEPVWVTGRLKVKRTSKSLSLIDGSAAVEAGYTLEGVRIEPYEEKSAR